MKRKPSNERARRMIGSSPVSSRTTGPSTRCLSRKSRKLRPLEVFRVHQSPGGIGSTMPAPRGMSMAFHRRLLVLLLVGLGSLPVLGQQRPKVDVAKPLTRIVFGSCNDQDKPCPIWNAIIKAQPELVVLMGDNVHADP